VLFEGRDLTKLPRAEIEKVRGRLIGLVPQDPMSSLNPVWSIGFQVEETIRANGMASNKRDVRKRAIEVLREAGLADADKRLRQYPTSSPAACDSACSSASDSRPTRSC